MNYPDSLRYLNSFLNLERIASAPDNSLWNVRRMHLLLQWFGVRQDAENFLPVLIAGTKGKGSTGYFLESILGQSRIKTGFYSSPHLEDPRERIRINGRMVSRVLWAREVSRIKRGLISKRLPGEAGAFTYFEILTFLAILIFRSQSVRVAIFEVGMGGRLDATNVLNAPLVILTPVHLDHEAFLGNTIKAIAAEKAAVIRRGAQVVISPQAPAAKKVILQRIRKASAYAHWAKPEKKMNPGLEGEFQKINAAAALKAAGLLRGRFGFSIPDKALRRGLASRRWPGRLELFPGRPDFLLDAAHNPASIKALVRHLRRTGSGQRNLLIFGTSRDKKFSPMLQTLGQIFTAVILTQAHNPRAREAAELALEARKYFTRTLITPDSTQAVTLARNLRKRYDRVVVTGSFYLLGEIRPQVR